MAAHGMSQQMPQDYWKYTGKTITAPSGNYFCGITVGPNGNFYAGISTNSNYGAPWISGSGGVCQIIVYDKTWTEISRFGSFANLRGIAVSNSNIYVFDVGAQNKIRKFDLAGNLITSWGVTGTGNGQFASTFSPVGFTGGANTSLIGLCDNYVYVVDSNNYRVQVFTQDGVFVRTWGNQGSLVGQFAYTPTAMGVLPNKNIAVATMQNLTEFTNSGSVVANQSNSLSGNNLTVTSDGMIVGDSMMQWFQVLDSTLASISQLSLPNINNVAQNKGICVGLDGSIWVAFSGQIYYLNREYNNVDLPLTPNSIPHPVVIAVQQRAATTYLDIDYKVTDADSPTVQVAALAFTGGTNSLNALIKLNTFVESTGTNIGLNIPANVQKRITWNAAADWSVDFGQVQIEILAKDERGLLPFHWITLPANGSDPVLTVSANPIADSDLLSLWYWLLATNDSAVRLQSGTVYGVGGNYDGIALASGISTASAGRQFLCERLGVRAITAPELTRAQAGNYNFNSLSTNSVVKVP